MKFLFFILPMSGHINPTLGVAKALVDAGDEVVYYLPPQEAPRVKGTGARVHVLGPEFPSPDDLLTQIGEVTGRESMMKIMPVIMDSMTRSVKSAPALSETVRAEGADCIVYDPMCVWGRAIVEMLGTRRAAFNTTYAMTPDSDLMRQFRAQMRGRPSLGILLAAGRFLLASERLHWRYGIPRLTPMSLMSVSEEVNLVPMPKRFQPSGDQFDGRYVFMGPSLMEQRDAESFPFEQLEGKPVLYISLGTTPLGRNPGFFRACFEAFGGSRWQVVMAVSGMNPASVGPVPENFLVRARVPQLEVLKRAQVFLTHCGMGSTMEGLSFGVPLVAVPQMAEQAVSATRIAELGAGIHLPPADATPDALRSAVEKVSTDPSYKQRVLELQTAIREAGGAQRGAEALRRHAEKRA